MTKKTEFRYFSILKWEQEQEYLSERHKQGWKFVSVTFPGLYHFEKCEPEDVVYQLDYNPQGIENHDEYIQMFHDCGWDYIQDFVGYSYFCKKVSVMQEPEEIFCDKESRLEMIRRVFRGRMTPLMVVFGCVVVPQLIAQFYSDNAAGRVLFIIFAALFILYLTIFVQFGRQYYQLKNEAQK